MMKVKFTNPSSGGIAHMGRPRVEIPGNGEVVVDFTCSDEKTEGVLVFLKARYPALKIEKVVVAEGEPAAEGESVPMTLDAFTAAAKTEEQEKGWNAVTVEGVGVFKVRNDKTGDKSVIELAYEKYTSGQGE